MSRVCCYCGCDLGEEQDYKGIEFAQGDADLLVFNKYPPGDDGLGYACGATCFEMCVTKWEAERLK